MNGYYQVNNEVLKFSIEKDMDKIKFNHYIIQRENFQRLKKELPRGQFKLTLSCASLDMGLSIKQVRGLIKKFIESGIITNISKPKIGSTEPSVYQYNSAVFIEENIEKQSNDMGNEKVNDKCGSRKGFGGVVDSALDIEEGNSKKEYKKIINKNIYRNLNFIDLSFIDDSITNIKLTQDDLDKLTDKYGKSLVHSQIIYLENYTSNSRNGMNCRDYYKAFLYFNVQFVGSVMTRKGLPN